MLTHGAAVSEKREKKMNARQMDVNKKEKEEHELAAEEGGQNMPKKGFISKRGTWNHHWSCGSWCVNSQI